MKKLYTQKICAVFFMVTIMFPSAIFAQTPDSSLDNEEESLLENNINDDEVQDESDLTEEQIAEFQALFAQQEATIAQNAKEGEIVSCFDYYSFGSLDINLTQNYNVYNAGDPIVIRGTITNNNPYPLVGLDIKARLVKDIPESDYFRSEIIVLEDFDIAQNINIGGGKKYDIAYSHILPLNAPTGEYQMYFYAVEQDRYNISGLSFTNDIVGSQISFDVKGNERDNIYLDQTQIMVGEQPYNVMGAMNQYSTDTSIPVSIPIYNPSTESKDMTITYNLYSWDSANSKNLIDTKTEQVTVESQSEKLLTYTLDKGTLPVYYLSIESKPTNQTKDESVFKEITKSNIRFMVQETSLPRLNFSTINRYPLKKGEEASIVTCFNNTGEGEAPYAKIETKLKDSKGRVLAQSIYEGIISPDITAIRKTFNPKYDSNEFTLSTIMYDQNNKIIDQVDKVYSCSDIDPDLCHQKPNASALIISLATVILIGLGLLFFTRKKMINIERV